ncbi:hypothetical protein EW146_g3657 [Bondarzewia mesenterica]|uniref:Uncharacterized protein n=1 Tax=Bondarzewia mesenterica TaxID=1095465 RepID=A0A4S4LYE5_9AGAM|nr:hypothetical protein EW146_g3657 [Bondarzewia mesenterica]
MRISSLFSQTSTPSSKKRLGKRKGGGGHGSSGGKSGGGGKSGSTSSGSSKGSSGSSKGGSGSSVSVSSLPGGKSSATVSGNGGGKQINIASGQPFAGRTAGGGTRGQVYGTSTYGSGYPGVIHPAVLGRGFPFFFWPIVWGSSAVGVATYLHDNEYGEPNNATRPGGAMAQASFQSNNTANPMRFHVLADNTTVASLITSIQSNCTNYDLSSSNSSTAPMPYIGNSSTDPRPEQAVQYFRASSVVLTLDGYNNTATFSNDTSAPPSPLPSGIDTTLLGCLNATIGNAAPLVDAASPHADALSLKMGSMTLAWVIFCLARMHL